MAEFADDFEEQIERELEEMATDDQAALQIGVKVLEMADRLDRVAPAVPGVEASTHIEIDDTRYKITLSIAR